MWEWGAEWREGKAGTSRTGGIDVHVSGCRAVAATQQHLA